MAKVSNVFILVIAGRTLDSTCNQCRWYSHSKCSGLRVRWVTSEFGNCSVQCGEGLQKRTVKCVHTLTSGGKKDTEVPAASCSQPPPPLTQPCKNYLCKGQWMKGEWSECSQTCGTGVQTRTVRCERVLVKNQREQVTQSKCPGYTPESSRQCYITDCLDMDEEQPIILSENYTLIQLNKAKKITVSVGGKVKIFPGQTIEVKCLVKHYLQELVYWKKGFRLVHLMGRVSNNNGSLVIVNADRAMDAGVYLCNAGDLKNATVTVQFITKDDPLAKFYKKTIRNFKRYNKTHSLKENTKLSVNGGVIPFGNEELNQQRDQSKKSTNFRMYATLEWSSCNATCRSTGYQQREVSCFHVTQKYVKIVSESECSDFGLEKPATTKQCSTEKECGIWRSGSWSECKPSCGQVGHKHRIVTCEWKSTGQSAWHVCDAESKPVATKSCTPRPCPLDCIDNSKYCSLARILKLCRYEHFRQECCNTCQPVTTQFVDSQ